MVARAADEIASGNLEIQLDVSRHDEIGLLAGSFQTMTENLRAIIQDIDYMLDEMSVGNFCINTREEARYVGEYGRILDSIRRINRTLSHTLRQIEWRGQSCLFWVRAGICRRSVYGAGRHGAGIRHSGTGGHGL